MITKIARLFLILFLFSTGVVVFIAAVGIGNTGEKLHYDKTIAIDYKDNAIVRYDGMQAKDNVITLQQKGSYNMNYISTLGTAMGFISIAITLFLMTIDVIPEKQKGISDDEIVELKKRYVELSKLKQEKEKLECELSRLKDKALQQKKNLT